MAHVLLGGVLAQITELVPPQPHHAALIELFPHTGSPAGGVEPVAHGLHVSVAEGGGLNDLFLLLASFLRLTVDLFRNSPRAC